MLKPKKGFVQAHLNIMKLSPLQWDGIMRAMDDYANHFHEEQIKDFLSHINNSHWIETKDKLPEPNKRVLIVQDVRKWDEKRHRKIHLALTGFFEQETMIGGPNALTGCNKMKGLYFSVPAILHPESVTHWMDVPALPNGL